MVKNDFSKLFLKTLSNMYMYSYIWYLFSNRKNMVYIIFFFKQKKPNINVGDYWKNNILL